MVIYNEVFNSGKNYKVWIQITSGMSVEDELRQFYLWCKEPSVADITKNMPERLSFLVPEYMVKLMADLPNDKRLFQTYYEVAY